MAKGDEPDQANQDTRETPLTLAERLAAIREDCFGIGKEDVRMQKDGKSWTIKGHTVEAVLSEVRPLLAKHGVGLTPSLVERSYNGNRCDVIVDFEWECLDDCNDRKVIRWAGAGTDNGDKAFAKAGTNALKEHLKKLFLITDRDDAKEETDTVDHKSDEGLTRAAVDKEKEKSRRRLEQWATTFKRAIETAATAEDVDRLKRDNRAELDSEDLPDVTRQFFAELIAERKAELQ